MNYKVTFKPLRADDRYNTKTFKHVKISHDDNYLYLTSEISNKVVFIAPKESVYCIEEVS